MHSAIGIVKCVGLSNTIKVFDILVKNSRIEFVKVIQDRKKALHNIVIKGSLGQVKAGLETLSTYKEIAQLEYEIMIIPNFKLDIFDLFQRN
jgi:microcompartment protein CcmL/EutN